MSHTARRRRRTEELVSQQAVRRSPRISMRLSQLGDDSSHQLHITSRPSLSGYTPRRRTKSRSPAAVLNESGQTVPITFEDNEEEEETETTLSHDCDSHDCHGGIPSSFYGLDTDDPEYDNIPCSEPNRNWNVYDKERVIITTPSPSHMSSSYLQCDEDVDHGFFASVTGFFTSILYKMGSFLYLTAAAILCLDVIVLHRLFNFNSVSQRAGGVSRFFLLVLALFTLVGFLLGGHVYPGPSSPNHIPPINATMGDLLHEMLKTIDARMDAFQYKFRSDMDARVAAMIETGIAKAGLDNSANLMEITEETRRALQLMREDMISEIHKSMEHKMYELKQVLEVPITEVRMELDNYKKQQTPQVNDLRESLNTLLRTTRAKFDEFFNKQEGFSHNMTALRVHLDRHNERISYLEESQRRVLLEMDKLKSKFIKEFNDTSNLATNEMVVDIYNRELEKAISDRESPLRHWLDLVFASKNNLQDIHKMIEELQERLNKWPSNGESVDLSREDIQDMITLSLRKYSADRIGKFDFALESSGGSILVKECSPSYSLTMSSISLFGMIPLWRYLSTPKVIIQPSMYPGNCWATEGPQGHATIKLRDEVIITGVTIDHIPQELSPNGSLDTTLREFSVHGIKSLGSDEGSVLLGNFTYNVDGTPIQEFNIDAMHSVPFQYTRFEFLSNYGNQNYTCIYRVRVHGHYP